MADDIKISGHAGFTMGPVAQWVCVNAGDSTVAYVDTIERAQGFIQNANSADREDVLVEALKFYAHPMNWRVGGEFMPASPDCDRRPDCGDTARDALATVSTPDTKGD